MLVIARGYTVAASSSSGWWNFPKIPRHVSLQPQPAAVRPPAWNVPVRNTSLWQNGMRKASSFTRRQTQLDYEARFLENPVKLNQEGCWLRYLLGNQNYWPMAIAWHLTGFSYVSGLAYFANRFWIIFRSFKKSNLPCRPSTSKLLSGRWKSSALVVPISNLTEWLGVLALKLKQNETERRCSPKFGSED